jgi:hypothetical protein
MRTIAQGLALAVAAFVIPACGIEPPKNQEDPPPLTLASPEGGASEPHQLQFPHMLPDGSGGAIVVWTDSRSGNPDVFAQRVNGADLQ